MKKRLYLLVIILFFFLVALVGCNNNDNAKLNNNSNTCNIKEMDTNVNGKEKTLENLEGDDNEITSINQGGNKDSLLETKIVDVANDETNVQLESTIWNQIYFQNDIAPVEKTIEFNGVTYSGIYSKSIIAKCESYIRNVYKDPNGVKFGLKDNTDQLVLLNLMNKEFFDTEPFKDDVENPQQYALEYAKKIASTYIDITQYELLLDEPVTREQILDDKTYYITYYTYTFARKINDFYTSDYLAVKVTSKGNLASLYLGDIGAFDNIESEVFSIDKVNSLNIEKIVNIYQEKGYIVKNSIIDYQRLVMTPNGELGIYSAFKVILSNENDSHTISTGICLLSCVK